MTLNPALTINEAAERLGVHYMTVYRYIRLGMLPARKEGSGWRIEVADLERLDTSPSIPARKRSAPWHTRLQTRMLAGDEAGSWGVVEAAIGSGMEPRDFYCDILTPVLHAIGELWQEGEIGVEDEHLASNVAAALVGRLGPRFASRGRPKGTVVTATPAGERHNLGLAMLGDILRADGYRVLNLGADTPADALVSALRDVDDLAALALSVVNSESLSAAEISIEAVRDSIGALPVLAGGVAVPNESTAHGLGADGWGRDAREVGPIISRFAPTRRRTR